MPCDALFFRPVPAKRRPASEVDLSPARRVFVLLLLSPTPQQGRAITPSAFISPYTCCAHGVPLASSIIGLGSMTRASTAPNTPALPPYPLAGPSERSAPPAIQTEQTRRIQGGRWKWIRIGDLVQTPCLSTTPSSPVPVGRRPASQSQPVVASSRVRRSTPFPHTPAKATGNPSPLLPSSSIRTRAPHTPRLLAELDEYT
jgi:hypothetical protein